MVAGVGVRWFFASPELNVLREAGGPLPTKEIVARVMVRVGADRESGPARRTMGNRVKHALQC